MSLISDPQLLAQFASVTGIIELRNAAGTLVGQFSQRNPGSTTWREVANF